jgi:poly(A) polymerase
MIGDPAQRFREDPVRMLRAARFAAKLEFHIDPATRAPIAELAPMLERIPASRLFDEMMKLLLSGHAERGVRQLRAEGLHHGILPMLDAILDDPDRQKFIHAALHDTDERIRQGHSASPAFMLACLLWFDMQAEWRRNKDTGQSAQPALYDAMDAVLDRQRDALAFPRRFDGTIKEIWALQSRFEQRSGARPYRLLDHPRFRAGYDFLLIRARGGDASRRTGGLVDPFPGGRRGRAGPHAAAGPDRRRQAQAPPPSLRPQAGGGDRGSS